MLGNPLPTAILERGMLAQMEAWRFLYPREYNSIVSELSSFSRDECVARLRSIASEKGIDIDGLASRYGVKL